MRFNFNIDDIKYIKILYKGIDGPNTVKAAIKSINEREIVACMKFEEEFQIEVPQEITLSIICGDGLYRTKTRLKSYSAEAPYIFFYLETPAGIEYQQNREYFRISVQYNCAYYVQVGNEIKNFTTETCDISANGISIRLPEHIYSPNESEIDLMVEERLIHAKIQYIRSEKIQDGYKISFTFKEISNQDRDYLSKICIQKQLEQKRETSI